MRYGHRSKRWKNGRCKRSHNRSCQQGSIGAKGIEWVNYHHITRIEYFSLTRKSRWTSIGHPDRLKWPLIRRNGQLQRATWDEAMSLVTEKAQEVQSRLTNHGIGFYTGGQLFLEEYYVLAMVGKAGLNTLHM